MPAGSNRARPLAPALPEGARQGVVLTSAGRVHYVAGGTGAPLVLLHGGHGAWPHWHANFSELARHHTVVALDMPGFGQSDAVDDISQIEQLSHPVWEAICALRCGVLAHAYETGIGIAAFSFGTVVATSVALHHPSEITQLLLVSPAGLGTVSDEVRAIQARATHEARTRGLRAGIAVTLRELMLHQAARADDKALDLLEYCVRHTHFVSRNLSRATALLPMLERLTMPAHVVLGAQDPHQRHALAERRAGLQAALGASAVTVLQDAGHWLQYDQPDAFAALAAQAFKAQRGSLAE